MAFLTYRSSENYRDQQPFETKSNVIKGAPLSIGEVDANFASLNDQLNDIKTKYGIGITNKDEMNTVDDANTITASGFYRFNSNTANTPIDKTKTTSGVLINIINPSTSTNDGSIAISQILIDTDKVYFRTKHKDQWEDWNDIAGSVTEAINQIENTLNNKLDITGGTITGRLAVNDVITANNSINIATDIDNTGIAGISLIDNQSTKSNTLGFVGVTQTTDQNNKIVNTVIQSTSPSTIGVATERISIGWKLVNNTWTCFTNAPSPSTTINDPKQIATTGYTAQAISSYAANNNVVMTPYIANESDQSLRITTNVTTTKELNASSITCEGTISARTPTDDSDETAVVTIKWVNDKLKNYSGGATAAQVAKLQQQIEQLQQQIDRLKNNSGSGIGSGTLVDAYTKSESDAKFATIVNPVIQGRLTIVDD